MRDLNRLFDQLDEAIARSAEWAGPSEVESIRTWLADAKQRVGYLGTSVLVGIAGGSGSGKSAVLNALVGREVAGSSSVRPTTGEPLAVLPLDPETEIVDVLHHLGIGRRDHHELDDRLVLIDLPDVDSANPRHRRMVKHLSARLDALVWVLDPEKYNDQSIHVGLLDEMVRKQRHLIFVLNQADRVDPEQLKAIKDDLWKRLLAHGYDNPEISLTAAAPRRGDPIGIDDLRQHVLELVGRKDVIVAKLVSEVAAARETLSVQTGVKPGTSVGFDRLWKPVRTKLLDSVCEHLGLDSYADEVGRIGAATAVGTLRDSLTAWRTGAPPPLPKIEVPDQGWTGLVLPLNRVVASLAAQAAPRAFDDFGGDWPEETVRAVVSDVMDELPEPPTPHVPAWVTPATYAKYGLGIFAVIAVLVSVVVPATLRAGRWPTLLVAAAVALAAAMTLDLAGQRAGRGVGEAIARSFIDEVEARVGLGIDRRVAWPLREVFRPRAELAGSFTEVGLSAAVLATRTDGSNDEEEAPPEEDPAGPMLPAP